MVANWSCEFLHRTDEVYSSIQLYRLRLWHGSVTATEQRHRSYFNVPWQPLLIANFQAVCNADGSWRNWLERELAEDGYQQRCTVNRKRSFAQLVNEHQGLPCWQPTDVAHVYLWLLVM
jgi:hypothetical protein